ncbi:nibrin isoform X3 [Malaclemys terrapin pileata]|uniref:nibrin isoform X3 n=1 Tax=Malaclemys terrapin pileata TaxID=2991368 RepID=UPI0023A7DA59|nr:nibrin isoform X3 [Malaclemys terrapin pileata]
MMLVSLRTQDCSESCKQGLSFMAGGLPLVVVMMSSDSGGLSLLLAPVAHEAMYQPPQQHQDKDSTTFITITLGLLHYEFCHTIQEQTICALICNRPIIKPEYFVECIRAIQSKQQLPKLESFYPPVDEPAIGPEKLDLSMRHERKIIFRGKTFLFLSAKQHKKLSPAIILGGGEAKLLPERIKETSLLLAPEVCVIDAGLTNSQVPTSDSARNWIDSIITVLQSKNLRAIPEAEIGLAVIFMSLERYCNPQNQPGIPKQPVSPGSAILHPTLSQSSTVDESMMLVTTSDRAYVADTEPEEPCMEISGEKTEKTPKMDRRDKMYSQNITSVKETPSTSGSVNTGTVLPRMHRTLVVDQKSQPLSPSKILGVNRNRERASQQESNSIKHYFQAAPKKRERIEEGETSVPKLAKMEEKSSHLSSQTQPTTSLMWKSKVEQTQKEQFTLDLKTNLLPVDTSLKLAIESSKSEKDKTVTKNVSSEKPASKKRKELGDLVEDAATLELVFGSKELDWEAEMGDCGEEHGTNMQKKRRLETKGKRIEEENVIQEEANRILQENELGTVPTSKKKIEIKQESSVLNTDGLQDVSSNLPSRLLLTEFRSLVVSHPRPNSLVAAQINYKQLSNFKKFKKVPYPGAGQLPHIIGGSDLIGHHAKKNSQLEEWLRQEMEEQNRHAREESLADDLFRYDPNVKRRR